MADKTRVGINGFGRIGRQVLRAMRERVSDTIEVVAVNGLTDSETHAHLFKYDSSYGPYFGTVEVNNGDLIIDGEAETIAAAEPNDESPAVPKTGT